jgi:hypothetical protein
MKSRDLVQIFEAPDLSILTPKQMSFRLPLIVAAKLAALQRLYPNKTKTEVVGYLLASALDEFEEALPSQQGDLLESNTVLDFDIFLDEGTKGIFRSYVEDALRDLEKEAGVKEPMKVAAPVLYVKKENK